MLRSILIAMIASATPAMTSAAGNCRIDARSVTGTYGLAAQGVATAENPLVPVGPFAQAGTVSQVATSQTYGTISGTWSAAIGENNANGYTPDTPFSGTFQIDRASCAGEFKDFQLHGIYNLSCISGQLRQIDAIFVRNGFTSPIPLKHA